MYVFSEFGPGILQFSLCVVHERIKLFFEVVVHRAQDVRSVKDEEDVRIRHCKHQDNYRGVDKMAIRPHVIGIARRKDFP